MHSFRPLAETLVRFAVCDVAELPAKEQIRRLKDARRQIIQHSDPLNPVSKEVCAVLQEQINIIAARQSND